MKHEVGFDDDGRPVLITAAAPATKGFMLFSESDFHAGETRRAGGMFHRRLCQFRHAFASRADARNGAGTRMRFTG